MNVNIKDLSSDIQTLLELRNELVETIEALRLYKEKAATDLADFFKEYLADLDELIEKLARGTAEPIEAAPDPALADLLVSPQIAVPQGPPDNLPGGCTLKRPENTAGRGPKRP